MHRVGFGTRNTLCDEPVLTALSFRPFPPSWDTMLTGYARMISTTAHGTGRILIQITLRTQ